MLRAFRDGPDELPSLYQLVEIPVSIFDSIQGCAVGRLLKRRAGNRMPRP